ncbi:MAG: GNAT family N-acetyltransferase [Clostridiales bacterium]|nr:GNAT family N-acetyltransferase [Clostridiales bacterium]
MQKIGFLATYLKYRDKINPIFNSYSYFEKMYTNPKLTMFWIISNERRVGEIWIATGDDYAKIARIFVLKHWQNQGIAQTAILQVEQIFSSYDTWYLDTIMQEKNNCHLYEKLGYVRTKAEKKINSRMTVIDYEKHLK